MRLPRRAFLSCGCASVVAFAQTVASPDDVWREFLRWQKEESRSGIARTESWANRYTRKLTSDGVSPGEIRRRIAIITQKRSDPQVLRVLSHEGWRRNAESPGNRNFRLSPSAWLVSAVKDVKPPGKALDL